MNVLWRLLTIAARMLATRPKPKPPAPRPRRRRPSAPAAEFIPMPDWWEPDGEPMVRLPGRARPGRVDPGTLVP